jgi:hypothetical protein
MADVRAAVRSRNGACHQVAVLLGDVERSDVPVTRWPFEVLPTTRDFIFPWSVRATVAGRTRSTVGAASTG